MATGRKTVVVGQVIDPDTWGNPVWDQSVQTFASAADRTNQFPAPKAGAVTWLDDVKRLEVYNGAAWAPLPTTQHMETTGPANYPVTGGQLWGFGTQTIDAAKSVGPNPCTVNGETFTVVTAGIYSIFASARMSNTVVGRFLLQLIVDAGVNAVARFKAADEDVCSLSIPNARLNAGQKFNVQMFSAQTGALAGTRTMVTLVQPT